MEILSSVGLKRVESSFNCFHWTFLQHTRPKKTTLFLLKSLKIHQKIIKNHQSKSSNPNEEPHKTPKKPHKNSPIREPQRSNKQNIYFIPNHGFFRRAILPIHEQDEEPKKFSHPSPRNHSSFRRVKSRAGRRDFFPSAAAK